MVYLSPGLPPKGFYFHPPSVLLGFPIQRRIDGRWAQLGTLEGGRVCVCVIKREGNGNVGSPFNGRMVSLCQFVER